jgi:hypothetical protein
MMAVAERVVGDEMALAPDREAGAPRVAAPPAENLAEQSHVPRPLFRNRTIAHLA